MLVNNIAVAVNNTDIVDISIVLVHIIITDIIDETILKLSNKNNPRGVPSHIHIGSITSEINPEIDVSKVVYNIYLNGNCVFSNMRVIATPFVIIGDKIYYSVSAKY